LFRYRARNWPDILTESERKSWRDHCREQWLNSSHLNLEMFQKALLEELSREDLNEKQSFALNDLKRWVSEQWEILDVSTASV
jgi:exodeoxyribonuclease-1